MISFERAEKLFDDLESAAACAEWQKRMVEISESFADEIRRECAERTVKACQEKGSSGMKDNESLRDLFAAHALTGLLVGAGGYIDNEEYTPYAHGHCNAEIAKRCYAIADGMLKTREAGE